VSIRPGGFGAAAIHNAQFLSSTETLFDPFPIDVTIEGKTLQLTAVRGEIGQ
jgi:hypothetical protein